uniref:Nuclear pore complex protein Nup214 n=1 Tax=Oncorhynchus tshawytscha TaxID=74940 RepID=A0A8C8EW55_ONCTS
MQDFQFRQMKKTRVFDSPDDLPKDRSSLLAISNKFGLTFVGLDRKIKVNDSYGVPCDELTLSVSGMSEASGLSLAFYDVRTFINKARPQKLPFATLQLRAGLGIIVQDLKWNPVQVSMLATCLSDGSMMVLEVTDSITVQAQLPATAGITCVCWSPKGKQVAAGKMNATVSQYTPGLQEKKVIPCPCFYSSDNPVKVLDVQWLSTFVFAVAYAAADGCPETPPELVVISLPTKTEKREERYLNFNDPVYGTCTERQHHYFLSHIEDWDVVLAASAASIEVSVIAKQEDKTNWELWLLEDASRGELPVSQNNDDTLPLGMAIDYTSQQEIHITDEKTLPPAPTLLLLSTDGVLCPFSLLNFNPGVKQLVAAPTRSAAPPPPYPTSSLPSAPAAFPPLRLPLATTPNPPPPASSPASVSLFTAAPAPASSSGFSFSMPPSSTAPPAFFLGGSTAFSASPALGTPGSFSFSSKPLTETPAAALAFSVSAPKLPVVEMAPVPAPTPKPIPQRLATTSPIMVLRGTPEPTTPAVKMNLNDRKSSHVPEFTERPIWFINVASCRLCSSQIAHFQKELDDLKARSHKADFRVGTTEEMKELRKESEDLHVFTLEIKDTTESLHGDISTLKTTMLEGFAGAEDAKAQSELNRHRGYLQLLYKKPLDPRSEDQLKEIRRLYQYVKFAVEDVNDVLDLEWEKHLEKKKKQKHMIVPEREALFTALANNLDIINQQKQRLDTLVKDLHALRLYNKTAAWSTPAPSHLDNELESLRDALLKASLETIPKTTSKSPAKMSPMKQSQLRNFLSKRQTPPVRSTAPANLSRSAFLSPKYYADLDDVSSTSSLSQALDPEYSHYFAEEEPEPAPLPMLPLSMPRHPTVVRTPSIAPGFGAIQSTPFSKVCQGLGLSPIMSPGRKLLSLFDFYLTRLVEEQQVIQLCSCEVSLLPHSPAPPSAPLSLSLRLLPPQSHQSPPPLPSLKKSQRPQLPRHLYHLFPPASITPPAQAAPSTTPEPVHESTPAPEASPPAITPTPEAPPLAYPAPSSDKPGSIFTQPPAVIAVSTTVAVTSLTPVINTAAPASTTPTNSNSVFGQPAPASAAAGGFVSTGFGAPLATGAAAGFGKPVFGQTVGGFGQPAANVAGGFGFGQSAFGANPGFGQPAVASPAAVASTAASGGGLFGALSVSNASGFSFGSPSASTASSTGTGLFGQPSATPAFGQQSAGFGQGSAFGSNTTTTSSTGFSFGQTAGECTKSRGLNTFRMHSKYEQDRHKTFARHLFLSTCYTAINPLLTSVCPTGGPTLFGNSGAKTFGFGSPASTFGGGEQTASGTFSTGGGSVAAQGFGSFSTPAKQTGGFGSAPVFGSPPAFGGSPAFGGAAAFGSAPSFSSPMGSSASKVFGEGTAAANVGGFG